MAKVTAYDILGCDLTVAGIPIKDGLVSAAFQMEGDAFADEIGADGHVCVYATHENRCNVDITLKGSSEEHAKLSALHAAAKNATNGLAIVPLFFRDHNGTTSVGTHSAYIKKLPDKTFAASPGDVTWNLRAVLSAPLNAIIGGN